jgi:hypothetical protein
VGGDGVVGSGRLGVGISLKVEGLGGLDRRHGETQGAESRMLSHLPPVTQPKKQHTQPRPPFLSQSITCPSATHTASPLSLTRLSQDNPHPTNSPLLPHILGRNTQIPVHYTNVLQKFVRATYSRQPLEPTDPASGARARRGGPIPTGGAAVTCLV